MKARGCAVNPPPEGTGEEQDADGFGDATVGRCELLVFRHAMRRKGYAHFTDEAVRLPGKAA